MKRWTLFFCLAALAMPFASHAGEPLFVQVPATVDASATIPDAVRKECGIQAAVANEVVTALESGRVEVKKIAAPPEAGQGELLQLTILGAAGYGGGSWSGPKSMSVRVDLRKGDALLAMTVLSRSTGGGPLSGFTGTCEMIDRVAGALGKDTARWLVRAREAHAKAKAAIAPVAELPASAAH